MEKRKELEARLKFARFFFKFYTFWFLVSAIWSIFYEPTIAILIFALMTAYSLYMEKSFVRELAAMPKDNRREEWLAKTSQRDDDAS